MLAVYLYISACQNASMCLKNVCIYLSAAYQNYTDTDTIAFNRNIADRDGMWPETGIYSIHMF